MLKYLLEKNKTFILDKQLLISTFVLSKYFKKPHLVIIQAIENLNISLVCKERCFSMKSDIDISYEVNQEGVLLLNFYGAFKKDLIISLLNKVKSHEDVCLDLS